MKTILLLHGWNYKNYTNMTKSRDAWENRRVFVEELEKNYKVYKLNFPGFCGEKEPDHSFSLDEYAEYVNNYIVINNLKIDYILGYSFGGAVAIRYNAKYNSKQKLILVSPAIVRNNGSSKRFIKTPKIFDAIRNKIRDWYLIYIVKNPYMINGSKFLNKSYQRIVRIELIDEVKRIAPNLITIIYGEEDRMVNPKEVIFKLGKNYNIKIIKNGGHDIATTNTKELIKIIKTIK